MNAEKYFELKKSIIDNGYQADIEWSENLKPCEDIRDFLSEYIFVVCNSGMKAQIARGIFNNVILAMESGIPIWHVFKNFDKVNAINLVWGLKNHYFNEYLKANDKFEFCSSMPYMGKILKYHLAKNLGIDCIKPDRHLVRIANDFETDPFSMCKKLSDTTGDRLVTIDTVIWRAANLRLI